MDVPLVGRITASFGLAEFPTSAGDGRDLFAASDAALYEAKRQGRDRVGHPPVASEQNRAAACGVSTGEDQRGKLSGKLKERSFPLSLPRH
jgi:hypothetical protein